VTPHLLIKVSPGELLDRVSILELKKAFLTPDKISAVTFELSTLEEQANILCTDFEVQDLYWHLHRTNKQLWEVEDKLRAMEKAKIFNEVFVQLARQVYLLNDSRYIIKNRINLFLGSEIFEKKSYVEDN
jgi:predicted DNA-binding protein YlxM (UPF0122 family)